jgi:predicted metal-binding protein
MKTVPAPVSEALILICEKCGKKLVGEQDVNPSRDLQQSLKARIQSEGYKGRVRALVTSCMDVCPSGEIAIGISRAGGGDEFLTLEARELAFAPAELLARVSQ